MRTETVVRGTVCRNDGKNMKDDLRETGAVVFVPLEQQIP